MPSGIGRQTEQLLIRQPVKTDDGQGSTITWSTLDTIDAEFIPLTAGERLQTQQITASLTGRFRTRARADITTVMQALWQPSWPEGATRKIFDIHGTSPDPDDREFMFLDVATTEEAA